MNQNLRDLVSSIEINKGKTLNSFISQSIIDLDYLMNCVVHDRYGEFYYYDLLKYVFTEKQTILFASKILKYGDTHSKRKFIDCLNELYPDNISYRALFEVFYNDISISKPIKVLN